MVRRAMMIVLAMVFLATTAGMSLAMDKGNKRKGKYTYRKVYKACYERGAVDSKVPFISPADKTQADWTRIFESKDFEEFKCAQEWEQLSEEQMSDIYAYMYGHASDSPTPARCK